MDLESLFKDIVKSINTTEKCLMIYIMAEREAYNASEISDVGWIKSEDNPADSLSKEKRCSLHERLLDTGGPMLKKSNGSSEVRFAEGTTRKQTTTRSAFFVVRKPGVSGVDSLIGSAVLGIKEPALCLGERLSVLLGMRSQFY